MDIRSDTEIQILVECLNEAMMLGYLTEEQSELFKFSKKMLGSPHSSSQSIAKQTLTRISAQLIVSRLKT